MWTMPSVVLAKERGTSGTVKDGGEDVITHTLVTSHMTTIVIENKVTEATDTALCG